jgi:sec-independent protein translocase protein TatA
MRGISTLALLTGTAGGGELLLVFVVALVLFGSKRLPGLARSLGRAIAEFRRAAREVTDEIQRAAEPPPSPHAPSAKPAEKDQDHEQAG